MVNLRFSAAAGDRASLRTFRKRRRRVWRNVLTVLVVTALMVVLVMARRDQQDVGRCQETMRFIVRAFENPDMRSSGFPLNLPQPQSDAAMDRSHYHYSVRNAQSMLDDDPPVGIVCCDHPHRLFTRADGRYVVLFDGGAFRLEWLTERDFQQRAAGLRLPAKTVELSEP